MARLFFSYSHADEALRNRLETHLSMLKREGAIEPWHDRRIKAGDEFGGSIDAELERADIILLLVSADFLASGYCFDIEMKRALERHEAREARVIPVILSPCDWRHAPFGKLLAAPTDGKPIRSWPDLDEAFLDVVRMIRESLPKISNSQPAVPTPRWPVAQPEPRSSNLRIRQSFTEADKDTFLVDAFAFMARFFENSLRELQDRNPSIRTTFRQIDANRFTSVIYLDGKSEARCKITLGGMFGRGISFAYNDQAVDGTSNENLSVEADDHGLYLKALGMASMAGNGSRDRHLTAEGAAEFYWSLHIEPLQRRR